MALGGYVGNNQRQAMEATMRQVGEQEALAEGRMAIENNGMESLGSENSERSRNNNNNTISKGSSGSSGQRNARPGKKNTAQGTQRLNPAQMAIRAVQMQNRM